MTKSPRRPDIAPDGGGALPRAFERPRNALGHFIKWDSREASPTPGPSSPQPAGPPRGRKPSPAQLVARVTGAIERELSQIEAIVGGEKVSVTQRTEAEKRARTLALLARTLAEISKLHAAQAEAKADDDDAVPRDLDEFRRTLERRLEQMAESRQNATDRGDVAD